LGIAIGAIQGVNTTGLIAGDAVYVGANGGWTQTKPTGSNLIQNLGIVTKVGENGGGVVLGAGRSNDVPNIEEGYFWVGNSGSVATPTPTSSFATTGSNTFVGDQIVTGSVTISGSIDASAGIDFSSASGSGATSAVFDGYEEGTWTMGVTFGGNNVDVAYTYNTGRYTKVGNMVTVTGYLLLSSKGTSNGDAVITGLPYTIPNDASYTSPATLYLGNVGYANYPMAVGVINTTTIALQEVTEAGTVTNLTDAEFGSNAGISITLTYFV
jgi:hypothetical protein